MIKPEKREYDLLYSKPVSQEVQVALDECMRVAASGGSFEIRHVYNTNWRTLITIYLPPGESQ